MFDRYDDHSQTTIIRGDGGCTPIIISVLVVAVSVAVIAYMIAAVIWAIVIGGVSVAAIGGAVLINRDIQKRLQAREYRIVELAARQAAGVSADALYPPLRVIDAVPARALPAGQVLVNGRPRDESASAARRR